MAGTLLAVAIGGGALARDDFLEEALRCGAREALWVDPSLGWAERYRVAEGPGAGRDRLRFRRRELVWPGEVVALGAGAGASTPPSDRGDEV